MWDTPRRGTEGRVSSAWGDRKPEVGQIAERSRTVGPRDIERFTRRRRFTSPCAPGHELGLGHVEVERARVHIDGNAIAVLDERQGTADRRLR